MVPKTSHGAPQLPTDGTCLKAVSHQQFCGAIFQKKSSTILLDLAPPLFPHSSRHRGDVAFPPTPPVTGGWRLLGCGAVEQILRNGGPSLWRVEDDSSFKCTQKHRILGGKHPCFSPRERHLALMALALSYDTWQQNNQVSYSFLP